MRLMVGVGRSGIQRGSLDAIYRGLGFDIEWGLGNRCAGSKPTELGTVRDLHIDRPSSHLWNLVSVVARGTSSFYLVSYCHQT
jgi:hypothetical protein